MDWFSGIIVFLLIWWVALFTVLPLGVERDMGGPETTAHGAPKNANMKKKFLITTALSAIIWLVVFGLIEADIINFRDIADQMIDQDHNR